MELETLVIRVIGDVENYIKELGRAEKATIKFQKAVNAALGGADSTGADAASTLISAKGATPGKAGKGAGKAVGKKAMDAAEEAAEGEKAADAFLLKEKKKRAAAAKRDAEAARDAGEADTPQYRSKKFLEEERKGLEEARKRAKVPPQEKEGDDAVKRKQMGDLKALKDGEEQRQKFLSGLEKDAKKEMDKKKKAEQGAAKGTKEQHGDEMVARVRDIRAQEEKEGKVREQAAKAQREANAQKRKEGQKKLDAADKKRLADETAVEKHRNDLRMNSAILAGKAGEREARADEKKAREAERLRRREATREYKEAAEARQRALAEGTKFAGLAMGAVAAPIAVALGQAVNDFARFDQAMVESQSIMRVTADQDEKMRDVALMTSSQTVFGAAEVAKGYYHLASAGMNAEQAIGAIGKVSLFAQASMMGMEEASTKLVDIQHALGLASKDAAKNLDGLARVSDVLVKASTMTDASVSQLMTSLKGDAASTARSFGISVEQITSALMVYAEQGIKGQAAGGHLARAMRLLREEAIKHRAEFARLGVQVFDNQGKMLNLADIIGGLEKSLVGLTDKSKTQALEFLGFEARSQRAIFPLIGMSKEMRRYQEVLKSAGGATEEVAEKQMGSFTNQMKRMHNQLTAISIDIGAQLAPALLFVADAVGAMAAVWNAMPPTFRTMIAFSLAAVAGFVGLTAAIIVAGVAFNVAFGGVGFILGGLITAGVAVYSMVIAWVGAMAGFVVGSVGGLAAVRGHFARLWVAIKPIREALTSLLATLTMVGRAVTEAFGTALLVAFGKKLTASGMDWNKILATVTVAIYALEFAIINASLSWEFFTQSAEYAWLRIFLISEFFFRAQLPALVGYGWGVMNTFFIGVFNTGLAIYTELGTQLYDALTAPFTGKVAGGRSITDVIAEQMGRMKKKMKDIPFEMPERQITRMEMEMQQRLETFGEEIGEGFQQHLADRMRFRQEKDKVPEEVGEKIGEDITKGMGKELQKFDSVLSKSSEAITRWQHYIDRIKNPMEFRDEKGDRQLTFKAVETDKAAGNRQQDQQLELLRRVAVAAEEQNKKKAIQVQNANLE